MKKINRVKDLKLLIDKVMLPTYQYQTNFNSSEFMVDINCKFVISAKPKILNDEVIYEFVLDTQFLSNPVISYDELVMIKKVIEILEKNKTFVLKRLKKYTVDEYKEEIRIREERSEQMMKSLKLMITSNYRN